MYLPQLPALSELTAAVELAGSAISKQFGQRLRVSNKEDATPVTAVDRLINTQLARYAEQSQLGFLGEEGNGAEHADTYLYVDPLDGTGAYIRGIATATVIASIMYHGTPVYAIIHNPVTAQTWIASNGGGTQYSYRNGSFQSLKVPPADPQWLTAICAWPGVDHTFAHFQKRVLESDLFSDQQMGAFGIGGGMIASGTLHATAISATSAVETAAMSLIVREAGGVVIDLQGRPIQQFAFGEHKGKQDFLLPDGAILACNMQAAEALLALYV
jgi:fructose-1,6-bisphosphatase/inositol monophosphatase family enzyme